MGIDLWHGLRLDSRARAIAWPLFLATLVVDVVLYSVFGDYTSSVGASQILGPAITILILAVAIFAGPLFGLTAALFLGTLFYCFVASLRVPHEIGFAVGAIALWSVAAVALGVLTDRRRQRTEELERTVGRKVIIPLPASSAVEMRAALRALLRSHQMEEHHTEMVVLAAQEAYNNAVVHPPGIVDVSAQVSGQAVGVEVRDKGPGFDARRLKPSAEPDTLAERGRGLFLMHRLMDHVEIESGRSGTTVTMSKRIVRIGDLREGRRQRKRRLESLLSREHIA
jgi:serine/threonine-protein kinase RsbW